MTRGARSTVVALVSAGVVSASGTIGLAAPIRARPSPGSTKATVPQRVSITFAERQASSTRIEVIDPCGAPAQSGRPAISGTRVSVAVDATASGRYVVRYVGISSVSGEATRGSFAFRVRGVQGCSPEDVPDDSVARGIWDIPKKDFVVALGLAAIIGALGGLVYAAILGPKA